LPRDEAEFADYERRRRRKEEIDQRAIRDAEVKLRHELPEVWQRLPWWEKVGTKIFLGIIAVFLIGLIIGVPIAIYKGNKVREAMKESMREQEKHAEEFRREVEEAMAERERRAEEARRKAEEAMKEQERRFEEARKEQDEPFCDAARQQGITPPGC